MQITRIHNVNSTNSSQKRVNFNGLTKIMEKSVFALPEDRVQKLLSIYDKPSLVVGYFPTDILKLIQKNSSGRETRKKILEFQKGLAHLANKIRFLDLKTLSRAENIDIKDFIYRAVLKAAIFKKRNYLGKLDYPLKISFRIREREKLINDKSFSKTMQEIGLISEGEKIKFNFVGEGSFKNCFRFTVLDKNGSHKIHPKAFVIEKRENLGQEVNEIIKRKMDAYFSTRDYKQFEKDMTEKLKQDKQLHPKIKEKILEELPFFYDKKKYKTVYLYDGGIICKDFKEINGIFPEANAALKIRKDFKGKMDDTNIITPYIFDIKSKYGLLEYCDKKIPVVKKIYDFAAHHLHWIDDKINNSRHKKLIDFGCIYPSHKHYYND